MSFPRGTRLRLPRGGLSQPRSAPSCWRALERLSDDDRLVLSCRYLLDLGEEETGEVLSLRRGTVKSRTSRALGRLREQLGESRDRARAPPQRAPGRGRLARRRPRSSSRLRAPDGTAPARAAARARPRGPAGRARRRACALAGRPQRVPRDLPPQGRHRRARRDGLPRGRGAADRLRSSRSAARRPSAASASSSSTWASPDSVFVRETWRPHGLARLRVGREARLVLSELRGAVWDGMIKKVGSTGTRIEQVTVGRRARSVHHRRPALRHVPERERRHQRRAARTSPAPCCSGTGARCCSGSRAT